MHVLRECLALSCTLCIQIFNSLLTNNTVCSFCNQKSVNAVYGHNDCILRLIRETQIHCAEKKCKHCAKPGGMYSHRGADKSLARPWRKQANVSVEWHEFPSAPWLAGKKNLMTARVSMLLKSRVSLTCFRACFLPGQAKDLSAPQVPL